MTAYSFNSPINSETIVNDLNTLAHEQQREQAKIRVNPTLFVGLGGTGKDILLNLRMNFYERDLLDLPFVKYLYYDTDLEWKVEVREKSPLSEIELVPRSTEVVDATMSDSKIQAIRDRPDLYPYVHAWCPTVYMNRGISGGATQHRCRGRLPLFEKDIWRALNTNLDQIVSDFGMLEPLPGSSPFELDTTRQKAYVVCSAAGGTGSGSFLDFAYILRKAGFSPELFMILPDALQEKVNEPRILANGYAALAELELLNRRMWNDEPKDAIQVQYSSNPDDAFEWSGVPYQRSYLFTKGRTARDGGNVQQVQFSNMVEMIADYLFASFDSDSMGEAVSKVKSVRDNQTPVIETPLNLTHPIQVGNERLEYHVSESVRYLSVGLSKIFYPSAVMRLYCAKRLQADMIDTLLGSSVTQPRDADAILEDIGFTKSDAAVPPEQDILATNLLGTEQDNLVSFIDREIAKARQEADNASSPVDFWAQKAEVWRGLTASLNVDNSPRDGDWRSAVIRRANAFAAKLPTACQTTLEKLINAQDFQAPRRVLTGFEEVRKRLQDMAGQWTEQVDKLRLRADASWNRCEQNRERLTTVETHFNGLLPGLNKKVTIDACNTHTAEAMREWLTAKVDQMVMEEMAKRSQEFVSTSTQFAQTLKTNIQTLEDMILQSNAVAGNLAAPRNNKLYDSLASPDDFADNYRILLRELETLRQNPLDSENADVRALADRESRLFAFLESYSLERGRIIDNPALDSKVRAELNAEKYRTRSRAIAKANVNQKVFERQMQAFCKTVANRYQGTDALQNIHAQGNFDQKIQNHLALSTPFINVSNALYPGRPDYQLNYVTRHRQSDYAQELDDRLNVAIGWNRITPFNTNGRDSVTFVQERFAFPISALTDIRNWQSKFLALAQNPEEKFWLIGIDKRWNSRLEHMLPPDSATATTRVQMAELLYLGFLFQLVDLKPAELDGRTTTQWRFFYNRINPNTGRPDINDLGNDRTAINHLTTKRLADPQSYVLLESNVNEIKARLLGNPEKRMLYMRVLRQYLSTEFHIPAVAPIRDGFSEDATPTVDEWKYIANTVFARADKECWDLFLKEEAAVADLPLEGLSNRLIEQVEKSSRERPLGSFTETIHGSMIRLKKDAFIEELAAADNR